MKPFLKKVFAGAGFDVHWAGTCAEAVEKIRDLEPDCLLLDYYLPDGRADEICDFVRGSPQFSGTPIVLYSGDPSIGEHGYEVCNVDVFVRKGSPVGELRGAVKRQARHRALKRRLRHQPDLLLGPEPLTVRHGNSAPLTLPLKQFRLLELLVNSSPSFVAEDKLCAWVFDSMPQDPRAAISCMVYRLRGLLGRRLGRRIRVVRGCGWIYLPPRRQDRKKASEPASAGSRA